MAMRNLDRDILELLQNDAVTPDEVAKRLNVSWATANGHLLKLVGEGKVVLVRKGRVNVYQTKGASSGKFQVPKWIKPRSLEELSDELERYFQKNMTAAEMIEKERRKA
jgi:DNA-binding transcriptional ArsR family regulator